MTEAESDRPAVVFSLWHLFFVTASVAFGLAVSLQGRFDASPRHWIEALWSSLVCVAVSGSAIGFIERFRKRSYPAEPGHTLLVLVAFMTIADLIANVSFLLAWFLVRGLESGIWFVLACTGAVYAPNIAWRSVFIVSAVVALGIAFFVLYELLRQDALSSWVVLDRGRALALAIVAAMFGIVAGLDAWWHPRRDWLHWLGIATLLSLASLNVVLQMILLAWRYP